MDDLINIQEKLIFNLIENIKKNNATELAYLNKKSIIKLEKILPPFNKISYSKAIEILEIKRLQN